VAARCLASNSSGKSPGRAETRQAFARHLDGLELPCRDGAAGLSEGLLPSSLGFCLSLGNDIGGRGEARLEGLLRLFCGACCCPGLDSGPLGHLRDAPGLSCHRLDDLALLIALQHKARVVLAPLL
jgi:hypothetical protein